MTSSMKTEPINRDQSLPTGLSSYGAISDYPKMGEFSTSFDEFESLMSALGYRQPMPIELRNA